MNYHQIPIVECGEPLIPIPIEVFALESPHPYQRLGAPYRGQSPYQLRQSVIESLLAAQNHLRRICSNWQIQIFDAYRPIAVQQFMVEYTFQAAVKQQGITLQELSAVQRQAIWEQVYQIWAVPSLDPTTPPPHSTGAAVDITLVDAQGQVVNMGSPIDELSGRSHPNYFAHSSDSLEQQYHFHRQLLWQVMAAAGFQRHPGEWWHFCLGDQMWAWLTNQTNPAHKVTARYGRVD